MTTEATLPRDRLLSKAHPGAARGGLYRGWTMAAVGFVSVALVFGTSVSALPFIYSAVVAEFGWSLTEATLVFTYKNVASAAAALFLLGPLLERVGLRRLMTGSFITTGFGMGLFLSVDSLPTYYLAGAILGFGTAAAMIGTNVFVSRWFYRNQGFAVGLALTGASVGGMVFPVLTVTLIESVGWRGAMASLSLFIWLVALPIYLWKAKEEPSVSDVGPEVDGSPGGGTGARDAARAAPPSAQRLTAVCRTRRFWTISAALLLVAAADAAMVQHTPLLLGAAGISPGLVAVGLSTMFAFGIVGKIAAGRLYDACSVRGMALWNVLLAVSIALALPVAGIPALFVFAVVRGLAHGGLVPKPAVLAKHCFGPALMSSVLPVLMGVWLLGAGIGPVALSMLVDATGHYRHGTVLLVALSLLAAALLRAAQAHQTRSSGTSKPSYESSASDLGSAPAPRSMTACGSRSRTRSAAERGSSAKPFP